MGVDDRGRTCRAAQCKGIVTEAVALEYALTPPPADAPDICPTCRSWRPPGSALCDNCSDNAAVLGASVPVIPVSLYRKPSVFRDWLTRYKPNDEEDHPEYAAVLGTILARWMDAHGSALHDWCGGFDTMCVVPSATRVPPHPLEAVIDKYVPPLAHGRNRLLLRGEGDLGHRSPSPEGYVADASTRDHRVLLLDDVYTTGARAQSAAFALRAAGAVVPAVLVIGRRVNPEWRDEVDVIWQRQTAIPFRFEDPPWWRA